MRLKIPSINWLFEQKNLASQLQVEERFFQFWNEKYLSKIDYMRTLVTVASVSNNLSWIFFSAYQCAIRYHFNLKFNGTISLAVREISDAPIETTFDYKRNVLLLSGEKSWIISTNVDMILLFVKLNNPIEIYKNNSKCFLRSFLAPIYKKKSALRKKFETRKFLKNLNQGNLTLKKTKIAHKNIFPGKNIKGFGNSEQFFVMLSLGIFFATKVKSVKYKKIFFKAVKSLIVDFNKRNTPKITVRLHKQNFKKMIHIFDNLPERKLIVGWEVDKIIFSNLLR